MNQFTQLEQQLRTATGRQRSRDLPDETQALQQSYLALANLLDQQTNDVDEARLVALIMNQEAHPRLTASWPFSEAWLVMTTLAASLLLIVSLATTQFTGQARPIASVPTTAKQTPLTEMVPPGVAWDDDWDVTLDEVRDSAAEYRATGFTQFESTAWNASEALRELQADLNSL